MKMFFFFSYKKIHFHSKGFLLSLVLKVGVFELRNGLLGGGGVLGLIVAGYVPLASQSPFPIIVYSVANIRSHLSHFWANM